MNKLVRLTLILLFVYPSHILAMDDVLNTVMHPHHKELRYNSVMHPHDVPSGLEYSYSGPELTAIADKKRPFVIVHHGRAEPLPGYRAVYLHTEVLPLFVTRDVNIRNINLEQFGGILEGRLTSWEQLGGDARKIVLLRHTDTYKSKALDFQLATQQMVVAAPVRRAKSYQGLVRDAIADGGALILGLRGDAVRRHKSEISAIAIDRHTPMSGEKYPFRVPIHLYVKNQSTDARLLAGKLMDIAGRRAGEDGMDATVLRAWYGKRMNYAVAEAN